MMTLQAAADGRSHTAASVLVMMEAKPSYTNVGNLVAEKEGNGNKVASKIIFHIFVCEASL